MTETHQINKTTRIWAKFRSLGNVKYNSKTNELISAGMYGSQDQGTLIVVQTLDSEFTGQYLPSHDYPKYWVPAMTRYEPETLNHGGSLGAYRSLENTERVSELVGQLKSKLK